MPTIYGDKVTMTSLAGSTSFNDAAGLAVNWPGAVKVCIDDMPEWKDTVDLNVIAVPRGFGDGLYIANRFPARGKTLTVAGYAVCGANRATLDTILDRLSLYAFPANVDIRITRFEPVPKYMTGRLADKIQVIQYQPDQGALRFETTIVCSDPFKYDAVNVLSGTTGIAGVSTGGRVYKRVYPLVYGTVASGSGNAVSLFNIGTAEAAPVFTIHGPLNTGWRLENSTTGAEESFDVTLSTGDTLVIDNGAKSATLNGSPINGLLSGEWWTLAQGANIVKLFGDYNSTASFTVTAVSRWR